VTTAAGAARPAAPSRAEKGGGTFHGTKLLLCENPLPPLPEAIEAAQAALPDSNYYTEPYSQPLRACIAERLSIPEQLVHINAGSELILRQLFDRFGQRVHMLTPTYALFPEIARHVTETPLRPDDDFAFHLGRLEVPEGTTLVVIVNPNNPTGAVFDTGPLPDLLRAHPGVHFLVDEAFIDLAGRSVVHLVPDHPNLMVTRTLSKAHSLAGFRVGYAVLPEDVAEDLNTHNDAYPLARPSQAAALATLQHDDAIRRRLGDLRGWTRELARSLAGMGIRTFPSHTYFFLADLYPHDAQQVAVRLEQHGILIKPLGDARLGPGYLRVTTALPADNTRFVAALRRILNAPPEP
jgi:histidinol-phosphate aminotransferase